MKTDIIESRLGEMTEILGNPNFPEDDMGTKRRLAFLGYFPCPIRGQIRDLLHGMVQAHFSRDDGGGSALPWYVPGGCGGVDVYEDLWQIDDGAALPEVILSVDFGDFWRPEFRRKFVDAGLYSPCGPSPLNPAFQAAGLQSHPLGYTIFAAFPHVLLVDKTRLNGRPLPKSWDELSDPIWKDEIAIGGDRDDISTLLPLLLHKNQGDRGVRAFAKNVKSLRHSAQMAKLAGSGNPEATALSVMPWFFADTCPHAGKTQIVAPAEGALVSPIYLLAKSRRSPASQAVLDLLFSPAVSAVCRENWFPSAAMAPTGQGPDRSALDAMPLLWLGWDFLLGQDLTALKAHVQQEFMADWKGIVG